jgi:hypothetical protein
MTDIVENLRAEELPGERQYEREARIVMSKLLNDAAAEIERLREKCNRQAMVLRYIFPEKYEGTPFITGHVGNKDQNGMPEKLLVSSAYGCDFSYIYQRTERTSGPGW